MEITVVHLAAFGGLIVAANQSLAALREWGARKYRQGRHTQEDQSAIDLVKARLDNHLFIAERKIPEFEQVKMLVGENGIHIQDLTKQVDRLVRLQEQHTREHRISDGLVARIAEKLRVANGPSEAGA